MRYSNYKSVSKSFKKHNKNKSLKRKTNKNKSLKRKPNKLLKRKIKRKIKRKTKTNNSMTGDGIMNSATSMISGITGMFTGVEPNYSSAPSDPTQNYIKINLIPDVKLEEHFHSRRPTPIFMNVERYTKVNDIIDYINTYISKQCPNDLEGLQCNINPDTYVVKLSRASEKEGKYWNPNSTIFEVINKHEPQSYETYNWGDDKSEITAVILEAKQ